MNFNAAVLFFSALFAGMLVFLIPNLNIQRFKVLLSFSGAYLFSITVIHLLPEIFLESKDVLIAGVFVLVGFFFQMVLEYFSSGVEHGHLHFHSEDKMQIPYSILGALFIHAFLEGTLLTHPAHIADHEGSESLLYGLVFHKIPESFALASIVVYRLERRLKAVFLLVIFSLASPLGLIVSNLFFTENIISENIFNFLFAIVAGNFLYISTTIFFETSPNHTFKANKLLVSLLGAILAIIAELVL